MQTVIEYLHARALTQHEFVERNPHPFLVSHLEKDDLELRKLGFMTEAVSRTKSREYSDELRLLRNEGHELHETAESLVIIPIRKNPSHPYPERIVVGRTQKSDITIPDRRISKLHAYFEMDHDRYFLTDVDSRNGTKVQSQRLSSRLKQEVSDGDLVSFADFVFRFVSPARFYEEIRGYIVPIAHSAKKA
jgi:hypothetical protein